MSASAVKALDLLTLGDQEGQISSAPDVRTDAYYMLCGDAADRVYAQRVEKCNHIIDRLRSTGIDVASVLTAEFDVSSPEIIQKQLGVVADFIEQGGDPDLLRRSNAQTPLSFAVTNRNDALVGILLAKSDPNILDVNGRSALTWLTILHALPEKKEDMARQFLDRGADPYQADKNGYSPMSYAILRGEMGLVELFVDYTLQNRNLLENDPKLWEVFNFSARSKEEIKLAKLFFEKGLYSFRDHNYRDPQEKTFIMNACTYKNPAFLELLLQFMKKELACDAASYKEHLNATDSDNHSAVFFAAAKRSTKTLRLLYEYGADFDLMDCSEKTPLMHAAEKGDLYMVMALLAGGADADCENNLGRKAVDFIPKNQPYSDKIRFLLTHDSLILTRGAGISYDGNIQILNKSLG